LSDSRLGDQHVFVVDQGKRIGVARFDHGNVRQVARSEVNVFVERVGDDEHRLQAKVFQLLCSKLGLGGFEAKLSTTAMRSSRANWERIARRPARYIFLLTFCEKFLVGRVGECATTPTPQRRGRHTGAGAARAFLGHGFLVLCLTSARVNCARLPARALAWKATTIWCHERFVEVAAEDGVGRGNGGSLTVVIQELEFNV